MRLWRALLVVLGIEPPPVEETSAGETLDRVLAAMDQRDDETDTRLAEIESELLRVKAEIMRDAARRRDRP